MRISDWSSDVCSSDLAEAAPLALKVGPGAHQPARLIVQMGKLHLKRAFARGRPLPEYLEDQPGPVDHLCAKRLFKVALLDRADIAVHDDKLRLMPRDGRRKNFHLSGAEQGGRARAANAPDFGPDDVEGDGGGQHNRLLQPRFAGPPSTRPTLGTQADRPSPACNAPHTPPGAP